MVAHERLTEQSATMEWLLAKPRSFSNLPAFLDLHGRIFIINMNRLCKPSHRKKDLEKLRKFISQEQHIIILIKGAYCFYLKYSSDVNLVDHQNMIKSYFFSKFFSKIFFFKFLFSKIVMMNFREKLPKFSFIFFDKIWPIKKLECSRFWIIKVESFKIWNSASVRV